MTLVIDDLAKRFGEVQALDGVTFTVEPGQVFGFLGANGAGKTTTMRIVLGFLEPDRGTVMYGNWIAMSVVEEKSSRVMEVVLNAATPFQLLTGKVLGVGAAAFIQYAAIVGAGLIAVVGQGAVASLVLDDPSAVVDVPNGLTPGLLLLFGAYGVLGFLLYASLFAAAGSLVSRLEDVNAAVMPLTLASTGGYLVGVYAATGLLDGRSGWIVALSQVPFLSPFMILGRITTGMAEPWEIVLSIVLLAASVAAALWLAARIYRAGVLLYGQRPGIRAVVRLVRAGI